MKQAVLLCVLLLTQTSFAQTLYTCSGLHLSYTNCAELKPHNGKLLIETKRRLCKPVLIQLNSIFRKALSIQALSNYTSA